MNSPSPMIDPTAAGSSLTRREALKRAALFLGVAISPSVLSGVLHAENAPAAPGAKPLYLTAAQFETAAAIAECILPRTDTPGATDTGVPAFIDLMYGKYLNAEEKKTFATGLAEMDTLSTAAHQKAFARLSAEQQDGVLRRAAEAAMKQEATFLHLIREQTIVGYFTSEIVGKTVLHYDPVPGRFDACVPIAEVGKAQWTK